MTKRAVVLGCLSLALAAAGGSKDQTYDEFAGNIPVPPTINRSLVDAPTAPPTDEQKAKVAAAYWKMTKQGFPKAFTFFGKKRFEEINVLAIQGVTWIVQVNPQCSSPKDSMAGLAGSSTRTEAVFFVHCGERKLYFTESNIKARKIPGPAPDVQIQHPSHMNDEQAGTIAKVVKMNGFQCEEPKNIADAAVFSSRWYVTCENDMVYEVFSDENRKPLARRIR